MPHRYWVYGYLLASGRPLPMLVPAEASDDREPDIRIVFQPLTPPAGPFVCDRRQLAILPGGVGWFRTDRGLRFLIPDPNTILVDIPENVGDAELHTFLFGGAMAWLLHRRGRAPLHACVVAIDGRAVALAGDSGAGKSSLARALIARGHRLVSDDQAVIDPDTLQVQPGYPAIKLRTGSAELFGHAMPERMRVMPGVEKFHVPLPGSFACDPLPLALIVALAPDGYLSAPRLVKVTRVQSAAVLQRFVYQVEQGRLLDGGRGIFEWTMILSAHLPLVALRRPDDPRALDDMCDRVENCLAIEGAVIVDVAPSRRKRTVPVSEDRTA